ncbi:hypothetical protein ACMXYX_17865 (plasmid) [Neptuniibacter sp. QD72_48]|uniref:hypothetical protein n=1 Tax=Neptuniibacter sp. QD72_48 TaxID=3398214 RepID=UPI0039F4B1CA
MSIQYADDVNIKIKEQDLKVLISVDLTEGRTFQAVLNEESELCNHLTNFIKMKNGCSALTAEHKSDIREYITASKIRLIERVKQQDQWSLDLLDAAERYCGISMKVYAYVCTKANGYVISTAYYRSVCKMTTTAQQKVLTYLYTQRKQARRDRNPAILDELESLSHHAFMSDVNPQEMEAFRLKLVKTLDAMMEKPKRVRSEIPSL